MFTVAYSQQAAKFLKKAEKQLVQRIFDKIDELKIQPILHDTKPIQGYKEKLFRVRVGDYRILYDVDYTENKLGIVKIDQREKIYD